MTIQSLHVADNAHIPRLKPEAHFKGAVLVAGERGQGLKAPEAGLRVEEACLLDRMQRHQRGSLRAEQPKFHGFDVAPGARNPLEGGRKADVEVGCLFDMRRQTGLQKCTVHRGTDLAQDRDVIVQMGRPDERESAVQENPSPANPHTFWRAMV